MGGQVFVGRSAAESFPPRGLSPLKVPSMSLLCDGIVPECFRTTNEHLVRKKQPHSGKDFAVCSFHCKVVRLGVSPYDEGVHLLCFSGFEVDK